MSGAIERDGETIGVAIVGNPCPTVYVASDDGWQEIAADAFVWVVMEVKEPAQKPDEPNTGRRVPVCCERPHRRLATVHPRAAGHRKNTPRKAASSWG